MLKNINKQIKTTLKFTFILELEYSLIASFIAKNKVFETVQNLDNSYFRFVNIEREQDDIESEFEAIFDGILGFKAIAKKPLFNDYKYEQYVISEIYKPLKYTLYIWRSILPITANNTCLIYFKFFNFESSEIAMTCENFFTPSFKLYKDRILDMLLTSSNNIKASNYVQTESIVLNVSIIKVWKVITNWKIFETYSENIPKCVEVGRSFRVLGACFVVKGSEGDEDYNLMQVSSILKEDRKRIYSLDCYSGCLKEANKIKFKLEFELININSKKCLLKFSHFMEDLLNSINKNQISEAKQQILKNIKQSLEKERD